MTTPPFVGAQDLTLLMTKLYVPPPWPNLVERPRLIKRLDEGLRLGHRLTLISAPAGFGKTTLMSDWLHQIKSRTPVAWLSLDESDNEVTRFLTYAVAALRQIDDGLGQMVLSLLQSPQPSPLENLITLLVNDIATLPNQAVLAVDDYHVISNLEVSNTLSFLLANLPPQLHLVIASREDPMLPLPRLRIGRQVTEIRTRDLRFTEEEAAHFLSRTMGLNLTPKDVATLERRTEGWVAGLQMAALSLQDLADSTEFITAFAGDDRYVVDYLISEVVERQPAQIREFLLKTGFLDRLTASLCDVVTGRDDGRDSLTYLEGANLFLASLDNKRQWYRYHHLFRDLLRYRLREEVGVEGIRELHGRAAVWYAQNGFGGDAIHHYLAARDYDRAADLMESLAVNLIVRGQLRKVRGWLEPLPDDFVRGRPLLCVCYAWVLNLAGEATAVESHLRAAERALPSVPATERKDIQGLINTVYAYLARRRGDVPASIEYLRQAVADLAPDNLWVRSTVNLNLGFNYLLTGQLARAEGALQAARADAEASGAAYVRLIAMAIQANTYLAQGRLKQARRLFEEAIAAGLAQNRGRPYPPAGYAYAGLGQLLYELDDMEAAESHLSQAIELGELMADWSMIRRGLLPLAWLKQQRGEDAEAQALWGRALNVVRQAESKRVEAQLMTHQVRLWLAQMAASPGNPSTLAAAEEWAETYRQSQPDPGSYPQALAQMTLAWVELAQGRPDQALACLEPLAEAAAAGGWIDNLIKILALQALAQAAQGDWKSALDTLKRAFDLAIPEGYVRTFIDYGPPMRQLLQHAAMRGLAADCVSKLLAACSAEEPGDTPSPPPLSTLAPQPLVEPLTERELTILRLMAANLSHREIADELYLSVNTVKWYSTHIYSKLGVHRRADAVARAQALNIV
jgi:LuxR family maltose regulon positive regulatory protein